VTAREHLLADLNKVIVDAEQLLKTVGTEGGEQAQAFRTKVEENIRLGKERLLELEETLLEKTRAATQATDSYVHEHPWQTVGLFAGLGVVLGLLLNRR
jgi:ElaB/YqjD/DUF883 family membrane-anchored ribosome-binding protein